MRGDSVKNIQAYRLANPDNQAMDFDEGLGEFSWKMDLAFEEHLKRLHESKSKGNSDPCKENGWYISAAKKQHSTHHL